MLCTAHPKKGDLLAHEGLTAEEEEFQEQAARAQLGAILFTDKDKHRFFSKELMTFADPEFIPSPPTSPAWRRTQRKKQPARSSRAAAPPPTESENEEEPEEESRDLADMASIFWVESEDEGSPPS